MVADAADAADATVAWPLLDQYEPEVLSARQLARGVRGRESRMGTGIAYPIDAGAVKTIR
jgi:hypothetical protein